MVWDSNSTIISCKKYVFLVPQYFNYDRLIEKKRLTDIWNEIMFYCPKSFAAWTPAEDTEIKAAASFRVEDLPSEPDAYSGWGEWCFKFRSLMGWKFVDEWLRMADVLVEVVMGWRWVVQSDTRLLTAERESALNIWWLTCDWVKRGKVGDWETFWS